MIKINIINKTKLSIDEKGIKDYLNSAWTVKYFSKNVFIEILSVSVDEITDLNKTYLKHSRPTDVISFPNANPDNDRNISLGSIVFCPEFLLQHHETNIEVVEHGFLHLMGYDHEQSQIDWDNNLKELRNDISKLSN